MYFPLYKANLGGGWLCSLDIIITVFSEEFNFMVTKHLEEFEQRHVE